MSEHLREPASAQKTGGGPLKAPTFREIGRDASAANDPDLFLLGSYYFDVYILPFLLACARGEHQVEFVPGKRLLGSLQAGYEMSFERSWLGIGNVFAFRFRNHRKESENIIDALCQVVRKHPQWSIRWRAANILRHLKDERAMPTLQSAVKDLEGDVVAEARDACEEMSLCGTAFGRTYNLG